MAKVREEIVDMLVLDILHQQEVDRGETVQELSEATRRFGKTFGGKTIKA